MLRPAPLLITCALTNMIATAASTSPEYVATATYIAPSNRSDRRADAAFPEDGHWPSSGCDVLGLVQNSLFNYRFLVSIIIMLRLISGKEGTPMAVKSSISDLDAQMEKLRERRRVLIVKSAERFARAATKSGLAEMEITDEEVERIFEEIAARFRKEEKKGAGGPPPQARRPAAGGAGTALEVSHDG